MPGVGEKSARRVVFYILRQNPQWGRDLADAILSVVNGIGHCSECGNITDTEPCSICRDKTRNRKIICVVENEEDCVAIEQAGIFNGLYHVLGGQLSPLDDSSIPEESIERLKQRITEIGIEEIILATMATLSFSQNKLTLNREPSSISYDKSKSFSTKNLSF